ncbi:hypothetical protein QR680_004371 [Steinernema hermaphroditum]|uniref:lipoyl(octanoyl) transferase n=1 Tax=Steinernema hermaphroditum TaxID=289476 RepID=A0AA39HQQ3_9BILA|nr:hypothetical protein QR680_004371 [Steinernema hermaphroditum]
MTEKSPSRFSFTVTKKLSNFHILDAFIGRKPPRRSEDCVARPRLLRRRPRAPKEARGEDFPGEDGATADRVKHSPVFTVGIRERLYTAEEEERLRATGADFCRTNRGGLITFHGPGQLVAYPIVDLASLTVAPTAEFPTRRVGVRRFVHLVEETLIDLLKTKHGLLTAGRSPDTGVWLDEGDRKIAAIGLSIRRGISSHGLALNCNTDLKWFDEIVPCGIEGKGVTSISKELAQDVTVEENLLPICESFGRNFEVDVDTTLLTGLSAEEAAEVIS